MMPAPPPPKGAKTRQVRPTVTLDVSELHPGQREVLDCTARFRVLVAGRRWGKTLLGVLICLIAALRGEHVWWVAPIFPTANIGWTVLLRLARQLPRVCSIQVSESTKTLTIGLTGGWVGVRSSYDPDSLRGEGLDGLVLEEASYHRQRVWTEILRPMLTDTKGWALFIGTPAGRNWYADLFDRAKTRAGWQAFQKPSSERPDIDPQELADALEEMGVLLFEQEHNAQFIDTMGRIFQADKFRYFHVDTSGRAPIYHLYEPDGRVRTFDWRDLTVFGICDPAISLKQTADFTAIGVFGFTPEMDMLCLDVQEFREEHTPIVQSLATTELRWRTDFIGVDSEKLGLGIIQDAMRIGVNVQPMPNKGDKLVRARPVAVRMGQGKVWLDAEAPWRLKTERQMLAFPDPGTHDDIVDTFAYADAWRREALSASIRSL